MNPGRTLSSAQAVIDALAAAGALSPAEIAHRTGIARSSVYRLVEGLVGVGLAVTSEGGTVELSRRWLRLADAVEPAMTEWGRAREVLDDLAARTGQTAYLSVPRDGEAVCLAWAQGRGIDLLILKPGRSLPVHVGAAGRVILAHLPDLAVDVLAAAPHPSFTEHTLTERSALRADIARSQEQGWTLSEEDATIGIGAVGVPVVRDGALLGCLSLAGLIDDIRRDREGLVRALDRAAAELVAR